MSQTLVISDLHLGVNRTGGTTPQSLADLRAYANKKHRDLLNIAVERGCDRVLINGDLTDQYDIPLGEALEVYSALDDFLDANPTKDLVLSRGNHDLSKDSSRLGTVDFIGALLGMKYPTRFTLVVKPTLVGNIYVVPHLVNQDVFDLELNRVPPGVAYCALHCCFDNTFAGMADHSLNISREQAKTIVRGGTTLILGHEHQGRTLMGDKVIIVGNNFSQSVSDCLSHGDGQKDGHKYCLLVDGEDMELVPTWSPRDDVGGYYEIDWQNLASAPAGQHFIRVTGKATAAQAAEVIRVISKLRQNSEAMVITNAVKIDGAQGEMEIAESVEDIRAVNVLGMLLESLDPAQQVVVRKLLEEDVK